MNIDSFTLGLTSYIPGWNQNNVPASSKELTPIDTDKVKDPLHLDGMQTWMFASFAASLLSGYMPAPVQYGLGALALTAELISSANAFRKTKSVEGKVLLAGTLAFSKVEGIKIFANVLKIGVIGTKCFTGIKAAWEYRHVEKLRPLRNIIVLGTNAAVTAYLGMKSLDLLPSSLTDEMYLDLDSAEFKKQPEINNIYLFRRRHLLDENTQNFTLSKHVFDILKANSNQTYVDFQESSLVPFDKQGVCSAMSLDFISRVNSECTKIVETSEFLICVNKMQSIYKASTNEFASIQAAYNTITVVNTDWKTMRETISFQKMQALGSHHNLTLTPVTGTMYRDEEYLHSLENLPKGSYVARLLFPDENHKLEAYGHTVGFIKRDKGSIFYDNSEGAIQMAGDFSWSVNHLLNIWNTIPLIRIYKAECPSEGCSNLAHA